VYARQRVQPTGTNRPRAWIYKVIRARYGGLEGPLHLRMRTLDNRFSVAIAVGSHPFPFRTRKLSPPAPMVLGGRLPGRVGRRRISHFERGPLGPLSSFWRWATAQPRTGGSSPALVGGVSLRAHPGCPTGTVPRCLLPALPALRVRTAAGPVLVEVVRAAVGAPVRVPARDRAAVGALVRVPASDRAAVGMLVRAPAVVRPGAVGPRRSGDRHRSRESAMWPASARGRALPSPGVE
jgi:hypothetical protein